MLYGIMPLKSSLQAPFDILLLFSNDNGQSFSQPEKISESTAEIS